jgi:hypothetical protein
VRPAITKEDVVTRILELAFYPLALAALLLALARVLRAFRRARPGLCPGPHVPLWRILDPRFWLLSSACWYDLSGSIPDANGSVLCPECGTRQSPPRSARRTFRWRTGRAALAVLLVALACRNVRWIRSGDWAAYAPTPLLLALERAVPSYSPSACRNELLARVHAGKMWELNRAWTTALAVRALREDDIHWNADWGQAVLAADTDRSLPAIEHALDSPDHQTRQLAGNLLRQRWVRGRPPGPVGDSASDYPAPDRLLEVSVEGLADDRFFNAIDAFEFLCCHAERAAPFLASALASEDVQERFLAAAIASGCRLPGLLPAAAPILRDACYSNAEWGDAQLACVALFRAGPDALPFAEELMRSDDPQAAATGEYLVRRLRGEPMSTAEIRRLNKITILAVDPLDASRDYSWFDR